MNTLSDFDAFFYANFDAAMKAAYRFVGSDAEDIVQLAFVAVWKNRDHIDDPRAFLFKCIKNRSLDLLKRKVAQPIDSYIELPDSSGITDSGINGERLYTAIGVLKFLQKRIVELSVMGYTSVEIAALMDCSLQTIRNNKTMAIKELKRLMKKNK